MTPDHHPPDELLHDYVIGRLDAASDVLVASHLTLCPACRTRMTVLGQVGGQLLAATPTAALSDGFEDRLFAALDDAPPEPAPTFDADGVVPGPLCALVRPHLRDPHGPLLLDNVAWRWKAPGVHMVDLLPAGDEHLPLRLVRFAPGSTVPEHDHDGDERALILAGGWTDHRGHVDRGDFAFTPADVPGHLQRIDPGTPCVAVVLNDRPVRPRSWWMRTYARVRGL